LIDWPASFVTWDLLFLIPVPWAGPVLAPSIVAASLVIGGILALVRPARKSAFALALIVVGAAIIILSFVWNWREIVTCGLPRDFPWWIFSIGEAMGIAGLWIGLSGPEPKGGRTPTPDI